VDISIVLIAIVVILALFLITTYNRLITLRQRVKEAWSDIDIQLKRRHDLIPNLIETVKGYAAHERGTFEAVTNARAQAVAAGASGSPQQMAQADLPHEHPCRDVRLQAGAVLRARGPDGPRGPAGEVQLAG